MGAVDLDGHELDSVRQDDPKVSRTVLCVVSDSSTTVANPPPHFVKRTDRETDN